MVRRSPANEQDIVSNHTLGICLLVWMVGSPPPHHPRIWMEDQRTLKADLCLVEPLNKINKINENTLLKGTKRGIIQRSNCVPIEKNILLYLATAARIPSALSCPAASR